MSKNAMKLKLTIPKAGKRLAGWIRKNDRMVVIRISGEGEACEVKILVGHVCSYPGSHLKVDNVNNVVIWFNESIRVADCADDAHEEVFDIQDPLLLKREEAEILKDYEVAIMWFGEKFGPNVLQLIVDALNSEDLDKPSRAYRFAHLIQQQQSQIREVLCQKPNPPTKKVSWWRR